MLLAATFVIGVEIKGARRWISVPGLSSVQPSEFVKPSLAVISAWLLAQSRVERRVPGYFLCTLLVGGVLALLIMQPDLGMSIVVAAGMGGAALRRRPADVGGGLRRDRRRGRDGRSVGRRSAPCRPWLVHRYVFGIGGEVHSWGGAIGAVRRPTGDRADGVRHSPSVRAWPGQVGALQVFCYTQKTISQIKSFSSSFLAE